MFRSFTVAKLRGVAIEIHPTWLLILVLLAWTLSEGVFPDRFDDWAEATYWVVGVSSALLLFLTVLVHELAHTVVAVRRGIEVPKISLFIFGGVSHLSRQPQSAGEEFAIAIAGPVTSLVIAAVCGLAALGFAGREEHAEAIFTYLAAVNVMLALFNMLPGFPLDGGRVLRAIAWKKTGSFKQATRIAGSVGETFGYGIIIGGAVMLLFGGLVNGLWFMFIGWFLLNAAKAESQDIRMESVLGRLTARDVMRDTFASVTPGTSLQTVVDEHMLGNGERAVVVALGDSVLGILSVSDVRKVQREQWPQTPAQRAMTVRDRVVTVPAEMAATEVLAVLARLALNQVPVLADGRMVGMVSRREIVERLQLAESLAPRD